MSCALPLIFKKFIFFIHESDLEVVLSEFWGFTGSDILAVVVISCLCIVCLYHGRVWVKNL